MGNKLLKNFGLGITILGMLVLGLSRANGQVTIACIDFFQADMITTLLDGEAKILIVPTEVQPGTTQLLPSALIPQLSEARILLYYPSQAYVLKEIQKLNLSNLKLIILKSGRSLLVPDNYLKTIQEITPQFCEGLPEYNAFISERSKALPEQIQNAGQEILARARMLDVMDQTCLVASHHEPFIRWLGFQVVDAFSEISTLSPTAIRELQAKAQKKKVKWIFGNKKPGDWEAAQAVAAGQNMTLIGLAPFPFEVDSQSDTPGWQRLLEGNAQKIFRALE